MDIAYSISLSCRAGDQQVVFHGRHTDPQGKMGMINFVAQGSLTRFCVSYRYDKGYLDMYGALLNVFIYPAFHASKAF